MLIELNPTVDERIVREGDTLWDLAEEILGNPTLWPRVWAMNPEIANPHWIYPGDVVRFVPPTAEPPSVSQSELYASAVQEEWRSTDDASESTEGRGGSPRQCLDLGM